jgi:hypothetical protein
MIPPTLWRIAKRPFSSPALQICIEDVNEAVTLATRYAIGKVGETSIRKVRQRHFLYPMRVTSEDVYRPFVDPCYMAESLFRGFL